MHKMLIVKLEWEQIKKSRNRPKQLRMARKEPYANGNGIIETKEAGEE